MFSLLSKIFRSPDAQIRLLRLRVFMVGLARDFWKDGSFSFLKRDPASAQGKAAAKKGRRAGDGTEGELDAESGPQIWSADRVQILEKMWGDGHHLPGDDAYIDSLISPLGMTKEMSVLDLSAGLGGMARKIAADYGSYVTGFEADPVLASRGMLLSIAAAKAKQASVEAYTPESFSSTRRYDCLFARELFCKINDKERIFKAVCDSTKTGGGQVVFTDYLLDPSHQKQPDIVASFAREGGASPLSFIEMVKAWKGLGYDMRVAEDQTDLYRHEILKGMARLVEHLDMNHPDPDTKRLLLMEIDHWSKRLLAFKKGLKYYRFYGIRY